MYSTCVFLQITFHAGCRHLLCKGPRGERKGKSKGASATALIPEWRSAANPGGVNQNHLLVCHSWDHQIGHFNLGLLHRKILTEVVLFLVNQVQFIIIIESGYTTSSLEE